VPDLKEGLYFGQDLDTPNPHVTAAWLLHGANLFPKYVREHLHGGSSSVQATPLDVSTSSRHWELMR